LVAGAALACLVILAATEWRVGCLLFGPDGRLGLWEGDNLTLNVIMLIHPVDAIREWQMAGRVL
jgi:hypothetical protein